MLRLCIEIERERRFRLAHRIQDGLADMGLVEKGLDVGIKCLFPPDRLRMNAAKDQEMMVIRQIVQCSNRSLKTLVRRQKTERSNQLCLRGQGTKDGKLIARRRRSNSLGLCAGYEA